MANARLYEVRTIRGTVYALHDLATGLIWTERSEYAARQVAAERRLTITEEKEIPHEELLRVIGHTPAPKASEPRTAETPIHPTIAEIDSPEIHGDGSAPRVGSFGALTSLNASPGAFNAPFAVKYHLDEDDKDVLPTDDVAIIARQEAPKVRSVFCCDGEIKLAAGLGADVDTALLPKPPAH